MRACDLMLGSIIALIGLCSTTGCQPVPTHGGALEREAPNAKLSSHQLQVMVNEYVAHFAERVELRADQILQRSTDPAIRRNALLWKINGISSCFQAASRSDPLGAYLDIWILTRQMMHFFDSAEGEHLFGPWQSIASDECHALEGRLQFINREVGTDLPLGEGFVKTFAADFPLTSLYFDREPIASRYIEEVKEPARELFHVVAHLDKSLVEMRRLAALYAKYLPKQARWEAQVLLIDSTQIAGIQRSLEDLTMTAQAISRIAHVTESLPDLVQNERQALQTIVEDERRQTLHAIEQMRAETLAHFERERTVVLKALRDERLAVSRQLDQEVSKAVRASDDVSRRRVDQLIGEAPKVIDHIFHRIWQLCIVIGLIAVVAVLVAYRQFTRRKTLPVPLTLYNAEVPDVASDRSRMDRGKAA